MENTVQQTLLWAQYNRLSPKKAQKLFQTYRLCPLSNTDDEEELLVLKDFQLYSDCEGQNQILQRVVWNKKSGLIYNNPCFTPDGFLALFKQAGNSYGYGNIYRQDWLAERVKWVTERVENFNTVLDIGCGRGDFLSHLAAPCKLMGIDMDAGAIDSARAYFKHHAPDREAQFLHSSFESFSLKKAPDLMTMFHVLEHLPYPLETLNNLRQLASDETRLVVEVPVIEDAAKGIRVDLCGYFSILHLFHYSQATLKTMLACAGWQVVDAEQIDLPFYNGYRILAKPAEKQPFRPNEISKASDYHHVMQCIQLWKNIQKEIIQKIESISPEKPVVIYGAGLHSEYLAKLTPLFQQDRPFLFVDNDPGKVGTTLHGIPILKPDQIPQAQWQNPEFYVIPSTYLGTPGIIQSLREMGFPEERIIALYQF